MPPPSLRASSLGPFTATSPAPFSQQLLDLDAAAALEFGVTDVAKNAPTKKAKKVRLLLDPITELTDEELKARAHFCSSRSLC